MRIVKIYSGMFGVCYRVWVGGAAIGNVRRGPDKRWFATRVRDGRDESFPYRKTRSEAIHDLTL